MGKRNRVYLFVGTSNGQIFYSLNDNDSWKLMAENLPPVYSLNISVR